MEFTKESIEALEVNEVSILTKIAAELGIRVQQVMAVISLVKEGCTIPFISRYRKEMHGSLDEVQVRDCDHKFTSYTNLETRRLEIVRGIFAAGALTENLYENVMKATTLTELEDLWLPFKKKKKTRGMLAIERGLEPLAEFMLDNTDSAVEKEAEKYVVTESDNEALLVPDVAAALQGAQDVLAERVSSDPENRKEVRELYIAEGNIIVKGIGTDEDAKTSVYQMYWDFKEPLNQVKPHRILAIYRGEREEKLQVTIDVDVDSAVAALQKKYPGCNKFVPEAVEDGVVRLLSPAVVREIRGDQRDSADDHGIGVFSENLKNLLMQQPIKGTRILGVDPGIRTGTKCAALDETGKYLGHFVIHQMNVAQSCVDILQAIKKYKIQLVAVGNGTGSHEVQQIVSKVISDNELDVLYTVVDEDGASVYSASDIAREEFPDLDLTIRGAISIGRRLQDPLAELVKIDPKSIGVGLYQHDVNQKKLGETLDEVVGSVVNNVGVNINTASFSLLKYVSGINSTLAKKIVAYRDAHGKITSREDLHKISGMGEKSFEQCAGFLKIPESTNPLDNTWVHPENYSVAGEILGFMQKGTTIPADLRAKLKADFNIGEATVDDIVEELKKPNRDPRDGYPKPIMQKGVVTFEDLREGMRVTGKIKNVVDFGAFVDLGIKETALVHISEAADHFVADTMEIFKVGDVKEFRIIGLDKDRRRISLSLKSEQAVQSGANTFEGVKTPKKLKVVSVKSENSTRKVDLSANKKKGNFDKNQNFGGRRDDDGTKYSPFAGLLNK